MVNTTQEHLINLIGPFPSWWKIVNHETNDKASLFLSFHFLPLPPSLLFFFQSNPTSHLFIFPSASVFFSTLPASFSFSAYLYFNNSVSNSYFCSNYWEHTHMRAQTHSQMLVMRCTGAYPLSERCFSPYFPLIWCWESHFTPEKVRWQELIHMHVCELYMPLKNDVELQESVCCWIH